MIYLEKYRRAMGQGNYNFAYQLVMEHSEVAMAVTALELARLQGYLRRISASRRKMNSLAETVRQEQFRIKPLEASV